jgi:hypothetical protein
MESMLITDVIACFGKAFKEVLKQEQNGFST